MKAVFIVPFVDNQAQLPDDLTYATGKQVDVMLNGPDIFEERPVLDEGGNPTGETVQVWVGRGDPIPVTIDETKGGYVLGSKTPNDLVVVAIDTNQATIDAMSTAGEYLFLGYVEVSDED